MKNLRNMTIEQLADYYKNNINRTVFPKFVDWISNLISCELISGSMIDVKEIPIGGLFIVPWNHSEDIYMRVGDITVCESVNIKTGDFGFFQGIVYWLNNAKISITVN